MDKNIAQSLLIRLAKQHIAHLLPNEVLAELDDLFEEAEKTLQSDASLQEWQKKIAVLNHWDGVVEQACDVSSGSILDVIKSALFQNKKLWIGYTGMSERFKFNPFGLVIRDKQFFLIGSYWDKSQPYLLAVRKISDVNQTSCDSVQPSPNFNLQEWAKQRLKFSAQHDKIAELILEFPEDVLSYAKSYRIVGGNIRFKESSPGFFRLEAGNVENNGRLHQWISGFQNKVRVIKPDYLRQQIPSNFDDLTDLFTREGFKRLFTNEIDKYQKNTTHVFSLLFMDIDHFKKINDDYGHDFGDDVLKAVANCIVSEIREGDDSRGGDAFRYGGEEFVVLLPETAKDNAYQVAERIRKKTEQLEFNRNNEFKVTLSTGIAEFPVDNLNLHILKNLNSNKKGSEQPNSDVIKELMSDLTKCADEALYYAKEHGRNQSKRFSSIR